MRLRPKITPISLRRQSAPDVKILGSLFIPVNKFHSDQVNHSLGTMKALSVSTHRRAGGGTPRTHQQALLPREGNRLRGGNLLRGGKHQVGMNSDFSFTPRVRVFRRQAMAIPLQATGVVNTAPTPRIRRTPSHVIFLVWLKIVVSHQTVIFTSGTASRTRLRCCFLHIWEAPHFPHALQSDLQPDHLPDFYCCRLHTEIYPAQIHGMCLSIFWLKRTRPQI